MKGLILAAGLGTRLRPITFSLPKPLVPIANKPTFLYAVESFINCGIREIGIVINKEHFKIFEQSINDSDICGKAEISFIFQSNPKGIAHAILSAKEFIGNHSFLVQLGDNIIYHDYNTFIKNAKVCKILLAPVDNISRYGIVEFYNNKIINLIEKPTMSKSNLAMVGLYILTPQIFNIIEKLSPSPRGEYEITEALSNILISNEGLDYSLCDTWWKDTGTPTDILEANEYILENIQNNKTSMGKLCSLANTGFGKYVSIGNGCNLKNCYIDNSIILDNVKIENINISNSIIGQNCIIIGNEGHKTNASLILGNDSIINLKE